MSGLWRSHLQRHRFVHAECSETLLKETLIHWLFWFSLNAQQQANVEWGWGASAIYSKPHLKLEFHEISFVYLALLNTYILWNCQYIAWWQFSKRLKDWLTLMLRGTIFRMVSSSEGSYYHISHTAMCFPAYDIHSWQKRLLHPHWGQ